MGTNVNSKTTIRTADLDLNFKKAFSKAEGVKSILACFECGKCTSSCPVAEQFPLNPHNLTKLAAIGAKNLVLTEEVLRVCLTCGACQINCPQEVDFIEFIKFARTLLFNRKIEMKESHNGIMTIVTQIQANEKKGPTIPPNLVPEGYKISETGETAYFIGCLPLLDVVFDETGMNSLEIAQNAIKILNKILKIPPVIVKNALCCGHDQLWRGDFGTFRKLAEHNVKEFHKLGIKTIITTCAEGFRTLKKDYPKHIKNFDFEVKHISEVIAEKIATNELTFTGTLDKRVTYHDPCRLGRHMDVYTPPREIISSMAENGITFTEMERSHENSLCCGVSCFINCNDYSKALQMDRLLEAQEVADIMVTTCPKCQIHYNCMLNEKKESSSNKLKIEIADLVNLVAKLMGLS